MGAIAGGWQVIRHEFLVQSFSLLHKVRIKPAPTHLNLVDLRFLLLAEGDKIVLNFSALRTGSGDSLIQGIEVVLDAVGRVRNLGNDQSSERNVHLPLPVSLQHRCVLIIG